MKICIDPGHGGTDSGALGTKSFEKNITLEISKLIKKKLQTKGFSVILTREQDVYVSLNKRAQLANEDVCDLFVSIHCNSFTKKEAHGIETWFYPGADDGKELAVNIQRKLIEKTNLRDRGIKEENFAVLVEIGFISNITEEELLLSEKFQEKSAAAVVEGICAYCGIINEFKNENIDYKILYFELMKKNEKLKDKIAKIKNALSN